jgi:hypothetical protein
MGSIESSGDSIGRRSDRGSLQKFQSTLEGSERCFSGRRIIGSMMDVPHLIYA